MDIERHDGTRERRYYDSIDGMMKDAEREIRNPETKKIILWPKLKTPQKRARVKGEK